MSQVIHFGRGFDCLCVDVCSSIVTELDEITGAWKSAKSHEDIPCERLLPLARCGSGAQHYHFPFSHLLDLLQEQSWCLSCL
mmetsp:Transcript_30857/g.55444  ORF Transcript_30857/g.55444 Transcript_30857/m.55444 type:complete len:82 (-) Transcript_30857:48-293(-)